MSIKPSEQFHSALLNQYKEMIHEALLESDHLIFLDEELFNQKLKAIMTAAKYDGLTMEDIHVLVEAAKMEITNHQKVG